MDDFQPETSSDPSAAFLFVDIAGFTALTEAHGDQEAADLVETFCVRTTKVLPSYGAQHVKTIGDALMLKVAEPTAAIELGLTIVHDLMRDHNQPEVRAGLHYGPAVERNGDWFGAAVNLAARVSALASGGEVLFTEATRAATGEIEGVAFTARGKHSLRNIREPITIYAAQRIQQSHDQVGYVVDPVCRMAVNPDRAAGRLIHDGTQYYFCSLGCTGAFAADPDTFTQP